MKKILFEPFQTDKLTLKNKIVMAPMTRSASPNNIPTNELTQYYKRRAEGKVGLIITECTFIEHPVANGFIDAPAFFGKQALESWKYMVKEVHNAGAKIIPQIWHAGIAHNNIDTSVPSIGPVDIFKNGKQIVKAMDQKDIDTIIEKFTDAAINAKNLGFDGVEIHGAHGYIIDQFLWDKSNTRDDKYGGSIENRAHFACEIVHSIREAVGNDFPILFRFSQWKLEDYNAKIVNTPKELETLLFLLIEAGVDIFDVSTRKFWDSAFKGSSLSLAGWTKKLSQKPVIAVGGVGLDTEFTLDIFSKTFEDTPKSTKLVEEKLQDQEFDLIAVGRALLGDPNWAKKIQEDQLNQIIPFSSESLNSLT